MTEQTIWGRVDVDDPFIPWRHQVDGLDLLRKHKSWALFDDVGCGKTAPLAVRIGELLHHARTNGKPKARAIIIAEQTLIYQWPGDFQQVAPRVDKAGKLHHCWSEDEEEDLKEWDVRWITGKTTPAQRRKFWTNPPDVIVTNYEFIKSIEENLDKIADSTGFVVMACDEIHNLAGFRGFYKKAPAVQAKRVMKLAKRIPHHFGATASALANPDSPRVWGITYFLNPNVLPKRVTQFEEIFYDNTSPTYQYKVLKLKPTMAQELGRRLRTVSRRVTLKDTGAEVPDRIMHDRYVPMSPKLTRIYNQLKNEAVANVDDRTITRQDVLSRNMALLQVASGFVIDAPDPLEVMAAHYLDDMEVPERQILHIDSSHKDRALADYLNEIGPEERVIVWAHFTHEMVHLEEFIQSFDGRGGRLSRVDGKTDGRAAAIEAFKEGVNNTFLGQPAACGAGLNLQCAQHMVRWARNHFIIQHDQSLGRNVRAVRKQLYDTVNYVSIMADGTVDVRTEMRNRGKREFAGAILLDHLTYDERKLA